MLLMDMSANERIPARPGRERLTRPAQSEAELDRFRFWMVRVVLMFCAGTNALSFALICSGVWDVPGPVAVMTMVVMAVCTELWLLVRRRAALSRIATWIFISVALLQTVVTDILATDDAMRFGWHYPLMGAAYLMGGGKCGLLTTVASLIALTIVTATTHVFTPMSAQTLCVTLAVAAAAIYFLNRQFLFVLGKLESSRAELALQAATDPLTGLYNRLAFRERLDEIEASDTPYTIVLCDVDHFKRINDRFGHLAGDSMLKTIASCLEDSIQAEDMAVRYGGEEFCLLLIGKTPQQAAERIELVRQIIEDRVILFQQEAIRATASFGIAHSAGIGKTAEQVLQAADKALYAAKMDGRNRLSVAA